MAQLPVSAAGPGADEPRVVASAAARATLLEQVAAGATCGRSDSVWVPVPPGSVFAALQRIAPDELPPLRRALRLGGRFVPLSAEKPFYAQMLDAGFAVLGVVPLREVVVGRVAKPIRIRRRRRGCGTGASSPNGKRPAI